jgi:OOP family OmpA-OmpF porin
MPVSELRRGSVLAAAVSALLLTASCTTSAPRNLSPSASPGSVVFPEPSKAVNPKGVFVNPDNIRQVSPGMTKSELYALLGVPHFDEGVFGVTQWNYLFNFRKTAGAADYSQCQYQIDFDKTHRAESVHWKPESCRFIVEKEPAPSALPTSPAAPVSDAASSTAETSMPDQPIRLSADALFAFDSADLTNDGRESLGQFMQEVLVASQLQDILVVGYTDRIGSDRANLTLSKKRAQAVQAYLVQGGVPESAIRSEGRGSANPVVTCTNKDHRALIACLFSNRRVELSGGSRR